MTYPAAPIPPRPFPLRLVLALALILVLGMGVAAALVVPRLLNSDKPDDTGLVADTSTPATDPSAYPTEPDPEPTAEPTTEPPTAPTSVGLVALDPGLTDSRAADVAAMFHIYFDGINDKDYEAVGSVLDPAGSINPNNAGQMAELKNGTLSTKDSAVKLISVEEGDGGLLAEVTFRSKQKPGDGPGGRTGETCTQWDIVYTVSASYKILRSQANSNPC